MTDRPTKNSKQHVSAYHAVTIITKPGLDISYRRKSSCDGGLSSLMAFSAKKAENWNAQTCHCKWYNHWCLLSSLW